MEITRNGTQPSNKAPADHFTGAVRVDPLFQAPAPARVVGASVTFEPGARTAWPGTHTRSVRPWLSRQGWDGLSATADPSRSYVPAMWCGSRPERSTGMVPRPQRP